MRASFCKFSYFYWLQQILICLFLLLFGKTNVVAVVFRRASSAARSDSVRRPIRFRPPSDRIPSAVRLDSVRRPIGFRPPSDANLTTKKRRSLGPPLCILGAYGIPVVGMTICSVVLRCLRQVCRRLLLFSPQAALRSKPSCL